MKQLFVSLFRLAYWATLAGYLLCAFSSWYTPSRFFLSDTLALAYPFMLVALVLFLAICVFRNQKLFWTGLVCLLLGYRNLVTTFAFHPFAVHHRTPNSGNGLRVMTWNVFYFLNRHEQWDDNEANPRRKMIEAVRRIGPDVICFQEYLSYNQVNKQVSMNQVFRDMGYRYQFFSNDKNFMVRGGGSQIGTMILSRYPFADSGRIALNNPTAEHLEYVDITYRRQPIRIFATHLSSLGLYVDTAHTDLAKENIYELTYSRKGSVLRKIKRSAIQHEKESILIDKAIRQSPYPAIFCADMNSVPCTFAYRRIRGNLQDAFLAKGFGFGQTYDALSPTLRIDVCFADQRLTVTDCFVERLHGLSDHFPVITTLEPK